MWATFHKQTDTAGFCDISHVNQLFYLTSRYAVTISGYSVGNLHCKMHSERCFQRCRFLNILSHTEPPICVVFFFSHCKELIWRRFPLLISLSQETVCLPNTLQTLIFKTGPMANQPPLTQAAVDDITTNIMQARQNMLDATIEAAALKVVIAPNTLIVLTFRLTFGDVLRLVLWNNDDKQNIVEVSRKRNLI